MAGEGSRFAQAGYTKPKPFIDVAGKPMIVRVLENLNVPDARFILIARSSHLEAEAELVKQIEQTYNVTFLVVDKTTEGTACTVLFARELINTERPLLIANSDQIVDISIASFVDDCKSRELNGSVLCFEDPERNPKWSFAKLGEDSLVVEVQEKKAISDLATVGIYYFATGKLFVDASIDMIIRNERVNNEFYTCPVYNHAIKQRARIGVFSLERSAMHGIGTPEDLQKYLQLIN